jgi:hypothetical protein
MYNTLDEAKAALSALTSTGDALKADLANLVRQVSVQAQSVNPDATTVLYSGMIGDVASWEIVDSMKDDSSVRTVDKTIAADLLNSEDFKLKVLDAFDLSEAAFDAASPTHPAKQWLYRNADGPWVNVSERFVEATEGKVKLLTLNPDPEGVLYKYEIPKLLQKIEAGEGITEVDGISRADLLEIGSSYSTDVMRNSLVNNAITQTVFTKPVAGSYDTFLNTTQDTLKDLVKNAGAEDFDTWQSCMSRFEIPKAATKVLNKLGIAGGILSFGIMSTQAVAAELSGDSQAAADIVKEWAADAAGSAVGETIGGVVGGYRINQNGGGMAGPVETIRIGKPDNLLFPPVSKPHHSLRILSH